MTGTNLLKFTTMFAVELAYAEEKHPHFCDEMTRHSILHTRQYLQTARLDNESTQYADRLLDEELLEALVAYLKGDKQACLHELAQCGAVILRMMEFVANNLADNNPSTKGDDK